MRVKGETGNVLKRMRIFWEASRYEDIFFNTSTEASVAVNLVEGWGAKYKRARGHRSFAGDESLRKRK